MCGTATANITVEIEGVVMEVCSGCAVYGKILRKPEIKKPAFFKEKSKVLKVVERIVNNYAHLVKEAREKRHYSQEQFAKMLNERESLMQRIEAGKQQPNFAVAKKLEQMLHIVLIETITVDEQNTKQASKNSTHLTIGDILPKRSHDSLSQN